MANTSPTYQPTKVIVGQARMFIAPYNATTPAALPADTLALNGDWDTPWVPVGATEEGLSFKFSRKTQDIMIEEQENAIFVTTKDLTFSMDTSLSEDSLDTMKLAFGGGTITEVAGSVSVNATRTLKVSNDLQNLTFGFEALNEFGGPRRVLIPLVVSVADVETKFRRADDARRYSVSFRSLVPVDQCVIKDIKPLGVS